MHEPADFVRLAQALDDAIAALPLHGCPTTDPALQREYRDVMLMLLHTRERARLLEQMLATAPRR